MNLIATHNSATGEKSRTWLFSLMTPVARCQDLTIAQQYRAGCTYFDLRVRFVDGDWRLCHGLWQSERTLTDVLDELSYMSLDYSKPNVSIFYEGSFPSDYIRVAFLDDMHELRKEYPLVEFVVFGVKKPEWTNLVVLKHVPFVSDFTCIDWKNKTALFPFPRFWNKFHKHKDVPDDTHRMIDFLTKND